MRIRKLLILAALIPTAATIHAEQSGYLTFSLLSAKDAVTITGVTSDFTGTKLEIPAEIEWRNTMKPVTAIGTEAFHSMSRYAPTAGGNIFRLPFNRASIF